MGYKVIENKGFYVANRVKLIPVAEAYADKKHKRPEKTGDTKVDEDAYETWCDKWNLAFNTKMEKLYKKRIYCDECGGER